MEAEPRPLQVAGARGVAYRELPTQIGVGLARWIAAGAIDEGEVL
jgi:hypothetical protein